MKNLSSILLLAALLTACTPRLYPPEVPVPERYIHAAGRTADTAEIASCWWRMFGDTTLNRLVERALENNRDLAAAVSRVEEARANLGVVEAQFLPQAGVEVSAGGDYAADTKIVQSYAVEPTLSWEVPLFGSLRNARRAALAQIAAQKWACAGVRLSLAAQVATTYFTLLEYERDLAIARRSYELRRESAALIDSMHRYGMSDGVALAQARSLVYTAESDIPLYERAVEQTRLSLGTLLGEAPAPAGTPGSGERLLLDAPPAAIPAGLPSELLERRPDIVEARYRVSQAAANVGAARSARFPSLTLTARGGVAAASLRGLTSANPWVWEAAGSLVEPLFAFGKLRRRERMAEERYNQAALSYEQTVLTALQEVEQALAAVDTYRRQAARYAELVAANERIAAMTEARFRSGFSAYLDVIDAQRELYDSQMQYVNLLARQRVNYVNLVKALGGGW